MKGAKQALPLVFAFAGSTFLVVLACREGRFWDALTNYRYFLIQPSVKQMLEFTRLLMGEHIAGA